MIDDEQTTKLRQETLKREIEIRFGVDFNKLTKKEQKNIYKKYARKGLKKWNKKTQLDQITTAKAG